MSAFEFGLTTRIVCGVDTVDSLGERATELGANRVFLVTDPGVAAAGHAGRAEAALARAGLDVRVFADVHENPTTADVDACVAALGDWSADLFVAVGGGSPIDVAKGCNFLAAGGGRMEDYWGKGKAKGTLRPLIAVPTTAGTGSEVQSFALIEQVGTHRKMACGDRRAAPALAILDASLTTTQPPIVTSHTGLDAVGHAVETAVTTAGSPLSRALAATAFASLQADLPRVLDAPQDVAARERMLVAAATAGAAIENSMLGAAHALANPLTARFGVPHGRAVAAALAPVVRFNAAEPRARAGYALLARAAGLDGDPAAAVARRVDELNEIAGAAGSPVAGDVSAADLDALAADAADQWTAGFNPRPVDAAALRALYAEILGAPPAEESPDR